MHAKSGAIFLLPGVLAALMLILAGACSSVQPAAPTPVQQIAPTSVQPAAAASVPPAAPASIPVASEPPVNPPQLAPAEIVVYVSDLPAKARSEWELWDDPASPGGKLAGVANTGEELDPPPENDPHVTFQVPVQSGIPYRCWIHMKVGEPQGVSQANLIWVQFSDAVDQASQPVFKPNTESYLTAQGPTQPGWTWVGCTLEGAGPDKALVRFGKSADITLRLQAGMEGVGFDQFVLSPARYLENPPTEAVVAK